MNGPNLFGIYEKKAGVVSGYSYTEANKKSGTLKSVAWYFEEGGMVFRRGWCDTLKRVVWYVEEGDVVL